MADIRLPLGGLKFSVRVGIICVVEDRLLVNILDDDRFGFLPGGALGTDEDIVECAAREWAEETGTTPGPLRPVGVVENFFGPTHYRQHEIGFYLRMTSPPPLPAVDFTVLDSSDTTFRWLPLAQVASYPVLPAVVADLLDVPDGQVRHLVVRAEPGQVGNLSPGMTGE